MKKWPNNSDSASDAVIENLDKNEEVKLMFQRERIRQPLSPSKMNQMHQDSNELDEIEKICILSSN